MFIKSQEGDYFKCKKEENKTIDIEVFQKEEPPLSIFFQSIIAYSLLALRPDEINYL